MYQGYILHVARNNAFHKYFFPSPSAARGGKTYPEIQLGHIFDSHSGS